MFRVRSERSPVPRLQQLPDQLFQLVEGQSSSSPTDSLVGLECDRQDYKGTFCVFFPPSKHHPLANTYLAHMRKTLQWHVKANWVLLQHECFNTLFFFLLTVTSCLSLVFLLFVFFHIEINCFSFVYVPVSACCIPIFPQKLQS